MSLASHPTSGVLGLGAGSRLWWLGASLLVFVGGPVLLIVLTVLSVAGAWNDAADAARNEAHVETITAQVGRLRSRPQEADGSAELYLVSHSESLALAELQDVMAPLVEAASGRLIEVQMGVERGTMGSGKVSAGLSFDITNRGLLDLLFAVETHLPLLSVTGLDMRPAVSETDRPVENSLLRVDLTVEGYWRKAPP